MTDGDATYEVVVVGGGPAGLTTALYTTRLGHATAVVDRGGGRAAMMQDTHNVIGVPESVSGAELLRTARDQLESHGTDLVRGFVTDVSRAAEPGDDGDDAAHDSAREEPRFHVETADATYAAERVVLATGFADVRPDPPLPRTGRGLHYCLHCDANLFVDEPVYVMGHGDAAAHVAMIMLNVTDDVDLLLRGEEPTWSAETGEQLAGHPVDVIEAEVTGVENGEDGWLEALTFADGTSRRYRGGFALYGADYHSDLAAGLGCPLNDDGTVAVDDHGETAVPGVYAVGDLTPGHNQIPVAMGEGAEAGLAIHKDLRTYPRSTEWLAEHGPVDPADVADLPDAVRDAARDSRADAVEAPGDD
ncbi:MAG: NAD(P)/FAD-dependent oxidoreductase [Halobacteriaceae archaeon]